MRPLVVITSQTRLHNEKSGINNVNQSKKTSENMGNLKSKRSSYAQSGVVPFDVKLDKS